MELTELRIEWNRIEYNFALKIKMVPQRAHDVIIASLLRQNDVGTSFWRTNNVIITSRVRRVPNAGPRQQSADRITAGEPAWPGVSPRWSVKL